MSASAVVFAYHDVGVRCLSVLLAAGIDVRLIVTHEDSPDEAIWFASVKALAERNAVPAIAPEDPNTPPLVERIEQLKPDFIFSFYYRHLLAEALLQSARLGALNMHGSLLPRYRGRVPVNWAIIRGESETGATLHYMSTKPDAGDIVDQFAVPILPDDSALDVFRKVTCAAEIVMQRALPALVAGNAPRRVQDASLASYFGRRRPEDGRIDWSMRSGDVHNLVRGVAPPYPGAFFDLNGATVKLLRTARISAPRAESGRPRLLLEGSACFAVCGDGKRLRIDEIEIDGQRPHPRDLIPAGADQLALI